MTEPTESTDITTTVQDELAAFLAVRVSSLDRIDARCTRLAESLRDFVEGGGKRMRPRFAHAAYLACATSDGAGVVNKEHAIRAVAALELIQACALIHDDIIDDSATRRGTPTVHVAMAAEHAAAGWHGDPDEYGRAQAILVGDLALAWADEMFTAALLDAPGIGTRTLQQAHEVWADMKTEVLGGQMLDIHAEAIGARDLETPRRINRFKTAAYTIERPVHLGAVLAGATDTQITALREFGVDTGIAYQLVDDLLGVFGDPRVTGKPSGDDLREGKRTLLINAALSAADPTTAAELERMLGRDNTSDQLERAREILVATGAVDHVRSEARRLIESGHEALERLTLSPEGERGLRELAERAVDRHF